MSYFNYLQGGIALLLQVLLLNAMLRRASRQHWILLLYIIATFLTTLVVMMSLVGSGWSRSAFQFYWISEVIQQALIYCAIISFIHQHLSVGETRSSMTRWLIVLATLVLVLVVSIHRDQNLNAWMTPVSRDSSFVATILNLLLWTVLLRDTRRNHRLLMISGGLGVQLAGWAIAQGMRVLWEVSRTVSTIGGIIGSITYLLSLYIIYRAFSQPEPRQARVRDMKVEVMPPYAPPSRSRSDH